MRKDQEGWNQHQKLVLAELKRLSAKVEDLGESLTQILVQVETQKAKSATWGAAAGMAATFVMWALEHRK